MLAAASASAAAGNVHTSPSSACTSGFASTSTSISATTYGGFTLNRYLSW